MDSGLSPGFMQTYPSPPENKSGCGLWIHGVLKFHCFEMLFRKRSIRNSKWVGQLSHYLQPFFLHPFAFGIAVLPALSPTIAWTYSCRQFWKCRLRASETSLIRNRLGLQLPPNFWWSLINPGAIPACALKIIKFMLGFTATRWYKYVHVSAWTDFESLRLALFEDRASDLLSGVGRFLRNRREAPSRAGHAKLI